MCAGQAFSCQCRPVFQHHRLWKTGMITSMMGMMTTMLVLFTHVPAEAKCMQGMRSCHCRPAQENTNIEHLQISNLLFRETSTLCSCAFRFWHKTILTQHTYVFTGLHKTTSTLSSHRSTALHKREPSWWAGIAAGSRPSLEVMCNSSAWTVAAQLLTTSQPRGQWSDTGKTCWLKLSQTQI